MSMKWTWVGLVGLALLLLAGIVALTASASLTGCQSPQEKAQQANDQSQQQADEVTGKAQATAAAARETRATASEALAQARELAQKVSDNLKALAAAHVKTSEKLDAEARETVALSQETAKAMSELAASLDKLSATVKELIVRNQELEEAAKPAAKWKLILLGCLGLAVLGGTVYAGLPKPVGLGSSTIARIILGGGIGLVVFLAWQWYAAYIILVCVFAGIGIAGLVVLEMVTGRFDQLKAWFTAVVTSIQKGRETLPADVKTVFNTAVEKSMSEETDRAVQAVKAGLPVDTVLK